MADVIIPRVLEKMLKRDTLVKSSTLCPLVCELWDIMHPEAQAEVKRKICHVLRQAAESEFHSFLVWKRRANDDCAVEFVNNPVRVHGAKRDGAYKRLRNQSRYFIDRLVSGREFQFDPMLPFPEED